MSQKFLFPSLLALLLPLSFLFFSLSLLSAAETNAQLIPEEMIATHPWRIAFIPKFKFLGKTGKLSSYWQPAWDGARKAAKDFGVRVKLVTSDVLGTTDTDYVEPQIRLVADLIKHGNLDGIVIAPFDSDRLAPVVEKAITAGIPVIAMDTPVNSERVLTFVSFNNYKAGQEMGKWVVGQLGGKGKVLVLNGPQGQQNALDRQNGFLSGLQTGNIDILNTKSADWETEPARQITIEWLQKYPKINAIIAANDNMALGASQALMAANHADVIITGFDATDKALSAIKSGRMSATVDQAPGEQARLAIQLLIRWLEKKEKFTSVVFLPKIQLVTVKNVGSYLPRNELK